MNSHKAWFYFYSLFFILGVMAFGYFIPRDFFYVNLILFTGLFFLYLVLYRQVASDKDLSQFLFLAIILRLVLLFSLPQWSDDYIRFVWDGQLVLEGYNPYEQTPTEALERLNLQGRELMDQLYPQLNSPNYHSVYPPTNQLLFGLAVLISGGNLLLAVMVLRVILIGFELVAMYLIFHLLLIMNKPVKRVLLYALNPLVIMEISGNLHFEGLMLTMILGGIYFLIKKKDLSSGVMMGLAVGVKLIPLIIIPAIIKWLSDKRMVLFVSGVIITGILSLFPLFAKESFTGFKNSLGLYGTSFEFNASVYYLLRQLGYWTHGYNMISFFNPILTGLTIVGVFWFSFNVKKGKMESLIEVLLLVYWVYFLLNSVVHPWYILPALALSLFTEKKSFLAWSFLIYLSYHAYQTQEYKELAWILGLEYLGLFMVLGWDYGGWMFNSYLTRKKMR